MLVDAKLNANSSSRIRSRGASVDAVATPGAGDAPGVVCRMIKLRPSAALVVTLVFIVVVVVVVLVVVIVVVVDGVDARSIFSHRIVAVRAAAGRAGHCA